MLLAAGFVSLSSSLLLCLNVGILQSWDFPYFIKMYIFFFHDVEGLATFSLRMEWHIWVFSKVLEDDLWKMKI